MYSMTGYGKATCELDGRVLTIELKSVNHRYLDLNIRAPRQLICIDDTIRTELKAKLNRGRVEVAVSYDDKRELEKNVSVDLGLAKGYQTACEKLEKALEIPNDITVMTFVKLQDVLKAESKDDDLNELKKLAKITVQDAIKELNIMRETEGEKLKDDMLLKVKDLEENLVKIKERAPQVVVDYREKLSERMKEILGEVEYDEAKLLNEVAFFCDKANIDEEMTRLHSHFIQARTILSKNQPIGRKMDFLIQEINRETNTICSKSNDLELTNIALEMKTEIEKIREQVQNLE